MLENPFWQAIIFWHNTSPEEQTFRACASDNDRQGASATLQQLFLVCSLTPGTGSRRCTRLTRGRTDAGAGVLAMRAAGTFLPGRPAHAGVPCCQDVNNLPHSGRDTQPYGKVPRDYMPDYGIQAAHRLSTKPRFSLGHCWRLSGLRFGVCN